MQMGHLKKLQTWVQQQKNADTSIITAKNWDLHSRRVVGWAISKRIDTELCVTALRMALETRRARGCIHHSDRGVQYASAAYVALLRQHGEHSRQVLPSSAAL